MYFRDLRIGQKCQLMGQTCVVTRQERGFTFLNGERSQFIVSSSDVCYTKDDLQMTLF